MTNQNIEDLLSNKFKRADTQLHELLVFLESLDSVERNYFLSRLGMAVASVFVNITDKISKDKSDKYKQFNEALVVEMGDSAHRMLKDSAKIASIWECIIKTIKELENK